MKWEGYLFFSILNLHFWNIKYVRKGTGFIKIVEYGTSQKKTPIKLLYTGSNHYDLLI